MQTWKSTHKYFSLIKHPQQLPQNYMVVHDTWYTLDTWYRGLDCTDSSNFVLCQKIPSWKGKEVYFMLLWFVILATWSLKVQYSLTFMVSVQLSICKMVLCGYSHYNFKSLTCYNILYNNSHTSSLHPNRYVTWLLMDLFPLNKLPTTTPSFKASGGRCSLLSHARTRSFFSNPQTTGPPDHATSGKS